MFKGYFIYVESDDQIGFINIVSDNFIEPLGWSTNFISFDQALIHAKDIKEKNPNFMVAVMKVERLIVTLGDQVVNLKGN